MLRGLLFVLPAIAAAFYLPGVAVREYQQDERVDIKVCAGHWRPRTTPTHAIAACT